METKDKKEVVNYYTIETRDFRSETPEESYWDWDEISRKDSLDKATVEYEKQLATHETLRLVQVTHTTIAQFCKAPKIISEFEQSLNETSKYIYDYLVTFLKTRERRHYVCYIPIANDEVVTELSLSNDGQTIQVSLYFRDTPLKLSQLSIEDQLIIIKALEPYE